jgi:hypothetical protein
MSAGGWLAALELFSPEEDHKEAEISERQCDEQENEEAGTRTDKRL